MKLFFMLCGWALIITSNAQNMVALESKPHSLQERYYLMKTNSETYQDYKVIKEYILDGVWKITNDSLNKRDKQLADARAKNDTLQNKLSEAKAEVKSKTDSMADIVFAGSHINVLGKDFSKGAFLIISFIVFVLLALTITLLLLRQREMQKFVSESKLIMANLNNEYEEYKHKAVEKQIKLARDLQTERNKLSDLIGQGKPMA